MRAIAIVGVLVGSLAAAACDGDLGSTPSGGTAGKPGGAAGTSGAAGAPAGSAGTCGKVQPCGGSVVGSWTATATCVLEAELTEPNLAGVCPTAHIELLGLSVNGTTTFTSSTYQNTGTISIQTRFTMPLSCFGVGKDCAGLQTTYVNEGIFQSPTCAVQGTSCICALNSVQDAAESGIYTTSGTKLATTDTEGGTSNDPYCVAGNELHTIGVDMAMPMGPMGTANIQIDIVYTKR